MLFQEFSLRDLNLKNRIVMSPMCMYQATDGLPNEWHYLHYPARAVGQVGLIIVEATGVEPGGRITDSDLGLWNDSQLAAMKTLVERVHAQGSKISIQLSHAGRKSEVKNRVPVAPSTLAFSAEFRVPQELSLAEIKNIINHFVTAAGRAVQAGFDAIELHAAHGYLLNQFLSPLTNHRQDEYGGPPENRVRLLGEVISAVRNVLPKGMPLGVRVSAHEYEVSGNTPETVAAMLNLVKQHGIDLVHVSSGAITPTTPRAYPGYQIPFALTIRERTRLPVIGGGLVTTPQQAQQIVKAGVDLVFLGRELLRNPYWPLMAAATLGADIAWPEAYLRAR
ncbi:MAG TPA: NADH:flavin oxidoreductase/NADH oxidase [Patescibacteria group bacterium]|nr:NADH:flavin oxidoreductase/NADH oxidase [Patescibacteria group bacterium]